MRHLFGDRLHSRSSLEPAQRPGRRFLELATRANQGPPQGPAEYHYEYLLVVARKHDV